MTDISPLSPDPQGAKRALDTGRLAFGAATLGNLYEAVSDADAESAVRSARAAGIRYFDTAPRYGHGLSERRLGASLDRDAIVSTKVGRRLTPIAPLSAGHERHGFVDGDPYEEHFDYSYDGVWRAFEDSCRRLKREHIDILHAHDLGQQTHGDDHAGFLRQFLDGGYRALNEMKAQGLIGAIGLGVNEINICHDILYHADLDIILLAGRYTLLEQTAAETLFPRCQRLGVDIIAAAPFNSGVLAGQGALARYDYAEVPASVRSRVTTLEAISQRFGLPLAAAALQFPLTHPAVKCVLVGMRSATEVTRNLQLMNHPVPDEFWDHLSEAGWVHS
ncbi:MAG: aldo/keto reductase [Asticcacaulis sp.]